jgi:chromosome segregation protein
VDERALEELRQLDARDSELAAESERVRGLDGEVADVRGRAEEIEAFFLGYPVAEERARAAASAAAAELESRRAELADAERQLAAAGDDEVRVVAQRVLARASDHVTDAEARLERVAEEHAALLREIASSTAELPELAARAARISAEVDGVEAPGDPPRELVDWASRAHAALFVAAGYVDAQRERVIREANELATMLLGDATYGVTAAQALARVEATLR